MNRARLKQAGGRRVTVALAGLMVTAICTGAGAAEVYKVVDEQGRVTYTDSPPAGKPAEKVEIKQANTLPGVSPQQSRDSSESRAQVPQDYQLQISFPPDGYHVNPGERSLNVQVASEPALHSRHQLQITDNGEVVPGGSLDNIVVRGEHRLQARVLDEQGRVISESEPVHIYVHRPTVKRPPPKK